MGVGTAPHLKESSILRDLKKYLRVSRKEKRIIKLYAQRGIKVDISPFKAGYQVIPRDGSLLGNLRNNDKDGYIQNQLVPISKIISQESNAKIYLKANDPNNVLLAVCNNGEIEYTLLR